MNLVISKEITLSSINRDNATALFPLFKAEIRELSKWFPFDEDYSLEDDYEYIKEKKPPYEEAFIILYNGKACGRIGFYDYDEQRKEIYIYYWVAKAYRRKQIARDSLKGIISYLQTLHIKKALFDINKDNYDSIAFIKCLDKAELENEEKDYYVFSQTV